MKIMFNNSLLKFNYLWDNINILKVNCYFMNAMLFVFDDLDWDDEIVLNSTSLPSSSALSLEIAFFTEFYFLLREMFLWVAIKLIINENYV